MPQAGVATRSGRRPAVRRPTLRREWTKAIGKPIHVVAFACLLLFCFSATSYEVPLQTPTMVLALSVIALSVVFGGRTIDLGGTPGKLLLAYAAAVAVSVPFSIWLGPSIAGVEEVATFIVMFVVALNTANTRSRLTWLVAALVVLFVLYPGLGGVSYYLSGTTKGAGRANWQGVFGNSNMLAMAMLMLLPFAIALAATAKKKAWQIAWSGAGAVLLGVAVLTKSRAGFLALLLIALGTVSLSRRRARAAIAVAVAAMVVAVASPSDFGERAASIFNDSASQDQSVSMRRVYWSMALRIVASNPLTGTGIGTYERANAMLMPSNMAGGLRYQDTHNMFLNVWAEIGTPGLVAFTSALLALLFRSWRALQGAHPRDPMVPFVRAGMVSLSVFMLIGMFNSFQNAWFFFVIFAVQLVSVRMVEDASRPQMPRRVRRRVRTRRREITA